MSLNINQFAQTTVQGQIDLEFQGSVVSAAVSPNQSASAPLIAGQAVKVDNTVTPLTGVPAVLALAANTDTICGFVLRNIKDQSFGPNARFEMAIDGTVMYMTSDASNFNINRFQAVEFNYLTNAVQAWQGVNPICGVAYDGCSAAGSLIRVYVKAAAFANQSAPKILSVTATLAQINAGTVLIPGATGKAITVLGYSGLVTGAFATGTSIELESTNASPVAVSTIAEAGLTNGAVLTPNESHTTLGVGFGQPLGSGDGLKIINNGSAQTGGTNVKFTIQYTQA